MWYAHYCEEEQGLREQTVAQHAAGVSARAAQTLSAVGLPATGSLLGLLHDMGKAKREFQEYLFSQNGRRGEVDHASVGAIWAYQSLSRLPAAGAKRAAEMVGYALACHHGMQDCLDPSGRNAFRIRMEKDKQALAYDEAVANFYAEIPALQAEECLPAVVQEMDALFERTRSHPFMVGLAERLLLSALIDADWQDSASFEEGAEREEYSTSCARWENLLTSLQAHLTALRSNAGKGGEQMRQVRSRLSSGCAQAAERERGIYTLSLPTGAGKTLSSLNFALRHAQKHGLRRVFYIAPLLTILDQNAHEIREAVGDRDAVLEHTSDVIANLEGSGAAREETARYERLTERWEAPIVVTSLVQFLNTLFARPQSCIRRMQSLVNSVILMDEVQTVPLKMTKMFNQAINFLHEVCGCTVVLCSATQPDSSQTGCPVNFAEQRELVTLTAEERRLFERTCVVDDTRVPLDAEQLADDILMRSTDERSILAICNTKKQAEALFSALAAPCKGAGIQLYHLSAGMCKRHREDELDKIKQALSAARKGDGCVICVATQVVEAGVDFSFSCVYRVLAGVDNVMQAAGRCNRHGEQGRVCNVRLVRWKGENLGPLQEIKLAQEAAEHVLVDGKNFLSEAGIERYYFYLYDRATRGIDRLSYPVAGQNDTLYDLLCGCGEGLVAAFRKMPPDVNTALNQSFHTAADLFCVFDENTTAAIVPYGDEANELICSLQSGRANADLAYRKAILRKLKPYTVSLYAYQVEALEKSGGMYRAADGAVFVLRDEFYDDRTGVSVHGKEMIY